jgi:Lar family restriction alleviation protein
MDELISIHDDESGEYDVHLEDVKEITNIKKHGNLKHCPFCGGENIYIDGYETPVGTRWRVVCLDCMATVDPGWIQQKYRAIEAWNRRADGWIPVIECGTNPDGTQRYKCPECGHLFWEESHITNYCSDCGQRLSEPQPPKKGE